MKIEPDSGDPLMGVCARTFKTVANKTQGISRGRKDPNGIAVAPRALFMLKTSGNSIERLDER